jgi:hypothetical protein
MNPKYSKKTISSVLGRRCFSLSCPGYASCNAVAGYCPRPFQSASIDSSNGTDEVVKCMLPTDTRPVFCKEDDLFWSEELLQCSTSPEPPAFLKLLGN